MFFSSDEFDGTIDMALSLLGKMVVCTSIVPKFEALRLFYRLISVIILGFWLNLDVGSLSYCKICSPAFVNKGTVCEMQMASINHIFFLINKDQ